MRRYVLTFLSVFVLAFSMISCAEPGVSLVDTTNYNDIPNINLGVSSDTNDSKIIKAVVDLTNRFRTGNGAFYLNQDNRTQTNLIGKLSQLTLDDDLCRAAKIRANEIVTKFSHTRPNGKDCFSVITDLGISWQALGENIAAGSPTARGTFLQWKEDDKNYAGQGHRRNMLSSKFTRIGIAYAYAPNSHYKYYWVMILAK